MRQVTWGAHPIRVLIVGTAIATLALLAASFAHTPAAWAHDEIVGSTPSSGAVLTKAPASATIKFAEPPLSVGLQVAVLDATGANHAQGDPVVQGDAVVQRIDGSLPNGASVIEWRVVSADGHPVSGTIRFTLRGSSTSAAASPSAVASATERASTSEAPSSSPATTSGTAGTSGIPIGMASILVLIVVLGGGTIVLILARRGRRSRR